MAEKRASAENASSENSKRVKTFNKIDAGLDLSKKILGADRDTIQRPSLINLPMTCSHEGLNECQHCFLSFCAECLNLHMERLKLESTWIAYHFTERQSRIAQSFEGEFDIDLIIDKQIEEMERDVRHACDSILANFKTVLERKADKLINDAKRVINEKQREKAHNIEWKTLQTETVKKLTFLIDKMNQDPNFPMPGITVLHKEATQYDDQLRACEKMYDGEMPMEISLNKNENLIDYLTSQIEKTLEVVVTDKETVTPNAKRKKMPYEFEKFHEAFRFGDLAAAKAFYERPHMPSHMRDLLTTHRDLYDHGQTVLMQAARNGNLELVRYLVEEQMADLMYLNVTGENCKFTGAMAIHEAIDTGHLDVVKFMLSIEPKLIEARDQKNASVLHCACRAGHLDIVKFLVEDMEMPVDIATEDGDPVLFEAASGGHLEVIEYLIEKGADIYDTNNEGEFIFHLAAGGGDIALFEYLMRRAPDLVKVPSDHGYTALHFAVYDEKYEMTRYLIKLGLNLDATGKYHDTALIIAVDQGFKDLARLLIESGADLKIPDDDEDTPLHCAAILNDTTTARLLVERDPSLLKLRNKKQQTPLDAAIEVKNWDVVHVLVAAQETAQTSVLDAEHSPAESI